MTDADRVKLAVLIHNETIRLGGSIADIHRTVEILMAVCCADPRPQAVFSGGRVKNGRD